MKKMMLLASLVALVALMLVAAPAMANERHDNKDNHNHADNRHNDFCDFHDCNNHNDFCDFFDCNNFNRHNDFCDFFDCNNFNNRNFAEPEISQENEQNVQSGASSQSIIVEGGGDNSNQCVAIQPISNTGNATSGTGVLQVTPNNGSFDHHQFDHGFNGGGDVGVRDAGNLTINPSQSVTCDQQVNQAATAFNAFS